MNTEVHQLLRQEAFDESVLGNMIDTETISLLQFIFYPTETRRRHPITTHWTVDWDVATIIEDYILYKRSTDTWILVQDGNRLSTGPILGFEFSQTTWLKCRGTLFKNGIVGRQR